MFTKPNFKMRKSSKALYILFYVIAAALAIASLASLSRNSGIRFLKMLDFPRIQFFIALSVSLIILLLVIGRKKWYDYLLILLVAGGLFVQGYFLINYTSLVPVEVADATNKQTDENTFSVLVANVKMSNKKSQPLISLIEEKKPDMVLLMETDEWWNKQTDVLADNYPHSQKAINDVAYGMILYSKLPLKEAKTDYLNNENVPSFDCIVSLKNNEDINFHCLHPVPPTHFKRLPDNEGQKEEALIVLGNRIDNQKLPAVIVGDLNDVVWSHVDELTDTKDILYDTRVGRTFMNSYDAESFFMRWPLDHVLVTKEFELKKLERMPKIGSDHFPILAELVLAN